jgi:hypothetical protein
MLIIFWILLQSSLGDDFDECKAIHDKQITPGGSTPHRSLPPDLSQKFLSLDCNKYLSILKGNNSLESVCRGMRKDYMVDVGSSWGLLTEKKQADWEKWDCNRYFYVVGKVEYHGSKFATISDKSKKNPSCNILLHDATKGFLNWEQVATSTTLCSDICM